MTQSEDDDFILLTCEASANPEKVDFVWQRGGNDTVVPVGREHFSVDGLSSTLRLELDAASFGTYFWDALITHQRNILNYPNQFPFLDCMAFMAHGDHGDRVLVHFFDLHLILPTACWVRSALAAANVAELLIVER